MFSPLPPEREAVACNTTGRRTSRSYSLHTSPHEWFWNEQDLESIPLKKILRRRRTGAVCASFEKLLWTINSYFLRGLREVKQAVALDQFTTNKMPAGPPAPLGSVSPEIPLVPPSSAWRILCHRTGVQVSRSTFYRWIGGGKVFCFRLGQKLYVPMPILEELIKHVRAGERFL